MDGPSVAWYLALAAFLFGIGALGVLIRRNPLIVLLSLELMLNGGNLALIAFSRHFAERRGPDLRARRDGGRRVGGLRRARPRRRDQPAEPLARRRHALGAARMTGGAWLCLLAPLVGDDPDPARRDEAPAPRRRLARDDERLRRLRRRGLGVLRRALAQPQTPRHTRVHAAAARSRPRGRGSRAGSFKVGLAAARRPAQHDDDADRQPASAG